MARQENAIIEENTLKKQANGWMNG